MVTKPKRSGKAPVSQAVGRRKNAVARVFLRRGNGKLTVNNLDFAKYFDTDFTKLVAQETFAACPEAKSFDVTVNVNGGGKHSQADAIKLGMARALVTFDSELKANLRENGLLTVDARVKERKKPGQPGARKKFQFVKR